jgi:predicted DNA-binding transcriptional regulator AlpA
VHYQFIPNVKLGRAVRYDRKEIERWVDRKKRAGRDSLIPSISSD